MSTPTFERRWEWRVERLWTGAAIGPDEAVLVRGRATGPGLALQVDAPLHHDPPPDGPPSSQPGLWNYEVVELFVAEAGAETPRYLEVELGPHGHYWLLEHHGIRKVVREGLPLTVRTQREGGRWCASTTLPWSWLPPGPLVVNAFAIHGVGEQRRYLVMDPTDSTERPDFHRPGGFRPL